MGSAKAFARAASLTLLRTNNGKRFLPAYFPGNLSVVGIYPATPETQL
jgi:hypothetical protein